MVLRQQTPLPYNFASSKFFLIKTPLLHLPINTDTADLHRPIRDAAITKALEDWAAEQAEGEEEVAAEQAGNDKEKTTAQVRGLEEEAIEQAKSEEEMAAEQAEV